MRVFARLALAAFALAALALPAQALTVTARVSGGNIAVHSGPGLSYRIVGRIADGTEIPIDECTQNYSDSWHGSWVAAPAIRCAAPGRGNGAIFPIMAGWSATGSWAGAWSTSPRLISPGAAGKPLQPAPQLAPHHGLDHVHAGGAVIEAGDIGEFLAARRQEALLAAHGDFFQRLDAVGVEGRGKNSDLLLALARQRF